MSNFNHEEFSRELKDSAKEIEIEVPDSLRLKVNDTINNLKDKKPRRNYLIAKAAAFLLATLCTFNILMPTYAESLPIIGATFKSINEAFGYGGKYVDKAKSVSLTQNYDGITMTINNIYFDGTELAIAYELKSEKKLINEPKIAPIMKVDGDYIQYYNELQEGDFKDSNTYIGIATYVLTEKKILDNKEMNFIVNGITWDWMGEYPERMKFKIILDPSNTGKKIYKVNKEFQYDGSTFKIENVTVSPFKIMVNYNAKSPLIFVENKDDKTLSQKYNHDIAFVIYDENRMPINLEGGNGIGDYKVSNGESERTGYNKYGDFTKDLNKITIVPLIYQSGQWAKKSEKINFNGTTTIENLSSEVYKINKIDFVEDKAIINMNIKGYLREINYYLGVEFIKEGYKDNYEIGEKIDESTLDYPIILETKINNFKEEEGYNVTYTVSNIDKNKTYFLRVNNRDEKFLTDQSITLDLKK